MSEDWDVESYKTEFESEEHWELRKNFMLAHKDKLPEDEIVCLAQVFTNIEFLGCRYPDDTMRKVSELAKGIVESYREKKKNCLKRTFVAASEAAVAKVKGLKLPSEETEGNKNPQTNKIKTDLGFVNKKENYLSDNVRSKQLGASNKRSLTSNYPPRKKRKKSHGNKKSKTVDTLLLNSINNSNIKKLSGPFANFVLFICDEHPVNLLERNASLNKCTISWKFDPIQKNPSICSVYLNDRLVATAKGKSNKISRELAAREAIWKLQKSCYTIKIKAQFSCENTVSPAALGCTVVEETKVKCNIGEQIMKLMGWTGGGLGIKQQGRMEPVSLLSNCGREGLGHGYAKAENLTFRNRAKSFIKTWMQSDTDEDLVFSSEFSTDQRKILHQLATSLSLKSKSYGKNDERHLVVSKKPSPWQIVQELVKVGGSTSKYELIVPDTS